MKDLPKLKLGVDVDDGFAAHYITVKGKKDIIDKLKTLAGKSKEVFIATDPDREGEAIAYHLATEVAQKNPNIKRVLFNEITKRGIPEAMKHPREVDRALFDAQQARRVRTVSSAIRSRRFCGEHLSARARMHSRRAACSRSRCV